MPVVLWALLVVPLGWLGTKAFELPTDKVVFASIVLLGCFGLGGPLVLPYLGGRRRAPLRAELRRRYGLAPKALYVEEEQTRMRGTGAPTWTALVTANAQPFGGLRWVRVQLWRAPVPSARMEVRVAEGAVSRSSLHIEQSRLSRGEAELSPETRAWMQSFLDEHAASLTTPETRVCDGLPCELAVVGQHGVHEASCNLAGLTEAEQRHPTVLLVQTVLDASMKVPMTALGAQN